ncbi:YihY/virulence factor BrkB family protein [Candidatus Dormiibacter inghamiae]|uniref:YihY/virulence factor BrkB family protein n=1 Tax=Candidatus Dormiibacter inghamiae TaxID=3127013 RepID=UPI001A2A4EE5|nr:YihY/virulence factor BrkB family protein [Candidatus Dormibacteraeota bacterium]
MEGVKRVLGGVLATFPARVLDKYINHDDGPNWATIIAWNALSAIFPVVLALAAVAGFILGRLHLSANAIDQMVVQIIPGDLQSRQQAEAALQALQERSGLIAIAALLGFLYTASNLFGAMEAAFDQAFNCRRRDPVPQKLMSLVMMLVFTVVAIVAVGTSALLPLVYSLPQVPFELNQGVAAYVVQAVLGVVSGFVLFLIVYRVVPNRPLSWSIIWPGAVVAGVGFELLTLLFPLYAKLNPGLNQYGKNFALLFVLLAFFFFLGTIVMIGAEVNAVLAGDQVLNSLRDGDPAVKTGAAVLTPHNSRVKRAAYGLLGAGIGFFGALKART